jgi:hypothetical protein
VNTDRSQWVLSQFHAHKGGGDLLGGVGHIQAGEQAGEAEVDSVVVVGDPAPGGGRAVVDASGITQVVVGAWARRPIPVALDEAVPVRGGVDLVDAGRGGHPQAHLVHRVDGVPVTAAARQLGVGARVDRLIVGDGQLGGGGDAAEGVCA